MNTRDLMGWRPGSQDGGTAETISRLVAVAVVIYYRRPGDDYPQRLERGKEQG